MKEPVGATNNSKALEKASAAALDEDKNVVSLGCNSANIMAAILVGANTSNAADS